MNHQPFNIKTLGHFFGLLILPLKPRVATSLLEGKFKGAKPTWALVLSNDLNLDPEPEAMLLNLYCFTAYCTQLM